MGTSRKKSTTSRTRSTTRKTSARRTRKPAAAKKAPAAKIESTAVKTESTAANTDSAATDGATATNDLGVAAAAGVTAAKPAPKKAPAAKPAAAKEEAKPAAAKEEAKPAAAKEEAKPAAAKPAAAKPAATKAAPKKAAAKPAAAKTSTAAKPAAAATKKAAPAKRAASSKPSAKAKNTVTTGSSKSSSSSKATSSRERIAVVAGLRTPFQKQNTGFRGLTSADLATAVVGEMIQRSEVDPNEISLCVYGQVVPTLDWLNIAREVVLRSALPNGIEAFSVSRACATSIQAMTSAAEAMLAGQHAVAIAGGADSMSDVPLGVSKPLRNALVKAQKARSPMDILNAFKSIRPKDIVPPIPGFAREPTTGQTMGEACEKMAKENGISREWQDKIAHNSHSNAARAWTDGTYAPEVMAVHVPPYKESVGMDNIVRMDSKLESYSKLKPSFDRKYGTITAGNASPLTDGASALLLMTESKAKALGHEPLGYIKSWAYTAVDPSWQLLMGPVWAAPKALERAGLSLKDMDLVDMHEAFAAQVASNVQALASKKFCQERLGLSEAVGEIDPEKFNVNGGSIAIGHPFAATGGRMVVSTLRELKKRGGEHALLTLCAAGGIGAAVVLEGAN